MEDGKGRGEEDVIVDDGEGRVGVEGNSPDNHLIQHDAKGVDIGAGIQIPRSLCLLGRDVLRGPQEHVAGEVDLPAAAMRASPKSAR